MYYVEMDDAIYVPDSIAESSNSPKIEKCRVNFKPPK